MKRIILGISVLISLSSCQQKKEEVKELEIPDLEEQPTLEQQVADLNANGHQTFTYKEEDTTYLMQEYYIVFLKSGENRTQDSLQTAQLQKQHLEHLGRMADEGYASLIGPFGDDGEIRGIVVYNTPTMKMADSLAKLDPMVKAGRLKVEVHPWWAAKGSKLK
ncbi:hypothetical protein L1I30_02590 [Gillisia sp. M10.2A]|uniref:YCII-related domain-containing protein n=1 Tax=Gillisia lutea TaxID=2909668 RepID=A0ABS9EGG0_9FLAO|nr:YciI family protein [Gillisia lutea]MCF4100546.1 hypothetical protein [Gillisia lutea]